MLLVHRLLRSRRARSPNLGDDADTTAAIVGQIAGAYYGKPGIPGKWLGKLHQGDEIEKIAEGLYQAAISLNAE